MAPQSDKPKKSIKLTPGKRKQFLSALEGLKELYALVVDDWHLIPEWQREEILAHSEILAAYVEFFGQCGGEAWQHAPV